VRHRDRRDVGALSIDELVLPGVMIDLGHLAAGAAAEIEDLRRAMGGVLAVDGKAVLYILIVENLRNLAALGAARFRFFAVPIKARGAASMPSAPSPR